MLFGFLAISCWLFLLGAVLVLPIVVFRKHRLAVAALSTFLLGGLLAGTVVWKSASPAGLSFRQSLKAGLTDEGLREYGHLIEHAAEVAICLSSYAYVLGGGVCAGATVAGVKIMARQKRV